MEVTSRLQNLPGKGLATLTSLTGEAVALDIPGGRTLFMLLSPNLAREVTLTFEPDSRRGPEQFIASVEKLGNSTQRGRAATLPSDKYPKFATFRDIRDPKTVEVVEPSDFEATLGAGVSLRAVTVSISNDDVTTGVKEQLGYGRPEMRFSEWYRSLPPTDDRKIGPEDFHQGTE
jgi:hypothetical protein